MDDEVEGPEVGDFHTRAGHNRQLWRPKAAETRRPALNYYSEVSNTKLQQVHIQAEHSPV